MKKSLFALLLAGNILACIEPAAFGTDSVSARAAIVYEPVSGAVLYEKNADEPMLVASTTKIMTAMVVIENCDLQEVVDITSEHAATEGSSMYLRPGGEYTVEDLLYGLMLASGNDAAAALADHTAGSMEAFAQLMNSRCDELGLENTHFVNAHGLDAEGHFSCARDLALLTSAAMENPVFREIFATPFYSVGGVSYYNHNKLLSSCPGCIGGKTGYTQKAGRILVSCVEREGMELICVTISDPRDWEDHTYLYDKCFAEYEYVSVLGDCSRLSVVSGEGEDVPLCAEKQGVVLPKGSGDKPRLFLPRFVFAPVSEGEVLGWAEAGGERIEIYAAAGVETDDGGRIGFFREIAGRAGLLPGGEI